MTVVVADTSPINYLVLSGVQREQQVDSANDGFTADNVLGKAPKVRLVDRGLSSCADQFPGNAKQSETEREEGGENANFFVLVYRLGCQHSQRHSP